MEELIAWLQTSCLVLVSMGVVIELTMGAELGYVLISTGALSFAVATKIHHLEESDRKRKRRENESHNATDENVVS